MIYKSEIGKDLIDSFLNYDPDGGQFTWKVSSGTVKAGAVAGTVTKNGYLKISICGKSYRAHRLAWIIMNGNSPSDQLDHIDGNRLNNSISNLRECSNLQNGQNKRSKPGSSSKYLGVHWNSRIMKWQASIKINGVSKYLGVFDDEEDAYSAYKSEKNLIHRFNPIVNESNNN